ncbi:uncharacterized protein LOC125672394 [Ostrea edulis]|uniref:uncharacterized protein LOC125672394 n=1 Tax=Ostrea edulis TaxID=37623 RepID=UPI0024AF7138|nr:uncharacterized protein LOC125672394 [Ostrea edulis]
MELTFYTLFQLILFIDCGLCVTANNVKNSKSISVAVDEKSPDITILNDFLVIKRRPTKEQQNQIVTFRPTPKPTNAPTTTTLTPTPAPQKPRSVKRTFKIRTTITKVFHPTPPPQRRIKVFVRNWYDFIKNFRWSDFRKRRRNNRCPRC